MYQCINITLYIRSVIEQSAVVWHAVQKVALRLILGQNYTTYTEALKHTGLENLKERKTKLRLKFAIKCLQSEKTSIMFKKKYESS